MDFYGDLDIEIKQGSVQTLSVSFWNKVACEYSDIDPDSTLLVVIDMYWDIRRLPMIVSVINQPSPLSSLCTEVATIDMKSSQLLICSTEIDVTNVTNGPDSQTNDPWGENDEIEYVGVDDEPVEPVELTSNIGFDYIPDTDEEDNDDCAIDDEEGCDVVEHITNLENPEIVVGVTFEDRDTFIRAIRQYAILNEVEIVARYNEGKRYRAHCKGKKCKWRIHASQLQDERTWHIKKMPNKHYCKSTSKVENNCMANQFWVRDRVIQWLRQDPTTGPSALKNKLEEKYLIKLSYWIVYNGRGLAHDEILGKWEDSFDYAFAFKAEIERKAPGSIVEIDYEKVGSKMRFSRMFVALRPCIDGFKNGCRPYLGIDSTALTGRWKGQLAAAIGIDGHKWMFPVAYGVFGLETQDNWG
ncbi:uncharacterized protein LOC120653358 [Panicum virgatum]|uniref:uncharacterized protein LOC120653358 n=1 Tax=Panicum virgatum TaxID=38727 RepID=UPI0019D68C99|nr:uncharacterized protein LOC120653358 [Panicum virgatum]